MIVSKSHFDQIYGFEMSTFKLYQYKFHLNFKEIKWGTPFFRISIPFLSFHCNVALWSFLYSILPYF